VLLLLQGLGEFLCQCFVMIATRIDHTLLAATTTESQIRTLCAEAREWQFASICINPLHVALSAQELQGCDVRISTVIGYPLGATTTSVKIAEALGALEDGVDELDFVVSLGLLKGNELGRFRDDIASVAEVVRNKTPEVLIKTILELSALSREEKTLAIRAAMECQVDGVVTGTGMGAGGATVEDVKLLRSLVPPGIIIKANGGIRTVTQACALIDAGASRLGTSASISIVRAYTDGVPYEDVTH
jgi:deoxyribose-phosphate aldolase